MLIILNANILFAQYNTAEDIYINSVYYFNRLHIMRTSYDRWSNLYAEFKPGVRPGGDLKSVFSAVIDANIFSKDRDKRFVSPQTFGLAGGNKIIKNTLGIYALFHTSDLINLTTWDKELWSAGSFSAFSLGLNADFYYFSLQYDISRVNKNNWFHYTKAYSRMIRSHIGISFSNYEEYIDSSRLQLYGTELIRIGTTKSIKPDKFDFASSYFKYVNFGFRYFKLLKAKYIPNINFSLHQICTKDQQMTMPVDLELFFETRGEKITKMFNLKDYEIRLCTYFFHKKGKKGKEEDIADLFWRPAFFLALSYKSPEDLLTQTITESGKVYTGQHGFGGEIGWGYRILGWQRYGFSDNTFFKYSLYYNYSQYFERFPGIEWGMKCRILM
ncbi:MAG: hypothetical protein A2275_02330 [Bacteroidetes bacterium RIFOXYA12_FULL_35_11]|nr:MAG: hypothetical protein A2X01_03810 [Bacteroidetes bacterium GWF2_35_48]OFY75252.1 MAG: hypothetical protein A2275_02330 [Bacteroidetes bacterium RIFOXYA12_FULL_35_11]OFY96925.1 MAG: hypothetical protein A2309_07320 [Bacteroidetes bacterium RIFOXYB2_FULL_35_7]OFY97725.1 MAG: hypothetical protein A2491_20860 [Bacteroidetes bacterium RIFOXYC12_FULL_35_7]HBX51002.1 hypothetical protein [Bacteroidales bacterium]